MLNSIARRKIVAPTGPSEESSGYTFAPCAVNLPVTFEGKVIGSARLENDEYIYKLPKELEQLCRQQRLLTEFLPQAIKYDALDGHAVRWATVAILLKRSWIEPQKDAAIRRKRKPSKGGFQKDAPLCESAQTRAV